MTDPGRLTDLLAALPDAALVPVGWLRSQLAMEPTEGRLTGLNDALRPDLTVQQFGALMGRSASTARLWCEEGKVPGAWRLNGRAWRIPAASVERFRVSQGAPGTVGPRPSGGDLSDWRKRKAS